jgi:hypothetical protein
VLTLKANECPSNVGPVQKYLVNEYLSPEDKYRNFIQVSLALICYWYQKFHPNFLFEREETYWKEMIESLGVMLNPLGTYSLSKFDKEGNFMENRFLSRASK